MSTPTPEQMTPHMYLTFAEATIISANRMMKDKSSFLQRLTDLLNHTTDRVLLRDLQGLYDKVSALLRTRLRRIDTSRSDRGSHVPGELQITIR